MIPTVRTTPRLAVLLLATLCTFPAFAGEAQMRLERFLDGLERMRATFVQSLIDAEEKILEESEGVIFLERPGRFRAEYHKPYEQLYVADGERVWMYDPDLLQVTVRPQTEALGGTPAMLLSVAEPLSDAFSMKELGYREGYHWLELKPREKSANFEYIRVAMEGDTVRAMEMVDPFAQRTRIYFTRVERDPVLEAELFHFVPPAGVDVVGETE